MFTPLTAPEVIRAIGMVTRRTAKDGQPVDEFARNQLLSAYSASRHLAIEIECFEPELRGFAESAAASLKRADFVGLDRERRDQLAAELSSSSDPRSVGAAVCEALALLRSYDQPEAGLLRDEIHRLLRDLVNREVELLASGLQTDRR